MDASPVPLDPGVTVRPGQVVGLGWFCKKELSPDNRVWFDDDATDEHGLPAIRIDYALSAADEAAIAAAKVEIAEAAQALGRPLGEPFVMPPGSSLHYLGTTRMGTDGRRHQRLRPHRPRLGHRQPLRRRQQRHPDRHRLQPDRDRGRARRPHRPHPGRLAGRTPPPRRHPHDPPSPDRRQRPHRRHLRPAPARAALDDVSVLMVEAGPVVTAPDRHERQERAGPGGAGGRPARVAGPGAPRAASPASPAASSSRARSPPGRAPT